MKIKYITTVITLLICGCGSNNSVAKKENNKLDAVRVFAEKKMAEQSFTLEDAILEGQLFDSINSSVDTTRYYYLNVSKFLLKRGDALLAKGLGQNLVTLINIRPREFIQAFSNYNDLEITDLSTCIGAYIANYSPDKIKEFNNISINLSGKVEMSNPTEVGFLNKLLPQIKSTISVLNKNR